MPEFLRRLLVRRSSAPVGRTAEVAGTSGDLFDDIAMRLREAYNLSAEKGHTYFPAFDREKDFFPNNAIKIENFRNFIRNATDEGERLGVEARTAMMFSDVKDGPTKWLMTLLVVRKAGRVSNADDLFKIEPDIWKWLGIGPEDKKDKGELTLQKILEVEFTESFKL